MQNTWYIFYFFLIVLVVMYFPLKKRRRFAASRLIAKNRIAKRSEENKIMKEFAQRFIGKDVYIKLLDGNADGFIKEVTDGGIMLESNGNLQVVNLNYVIKIREYPYKKGKRATLWGE